MLLVDRAALWFPSLGSPILIEEHAVAHTSRIPCQELAVPYLAPGCKFLEPLGVAESTDHVILRDLADTGFEFIHSGMAT